VLYTNSRQNQFDIIINATSLSLQGALPALPDDIFAGNPCVYDMVYLSQPTVFLQKAADIGCTNTIDGLGMLVNQAAHSFYLWFNKKPECAPVYKYLRGLTNT
jgi:shikimate dehydrogenase